LRIQLAADLVVGEELGDRQVESPGNLRQSVERRDRVPVFNARQIATQKAGFLFDIALRESLLQPVRTNCGANLH